MVYDGGDQPRFVSSNSGWGRFVRWVESLPQGLAPNLLHLVTNGWDEDLSDIEHELTTAHNDYTSEWDDVQLTAVNVIEAIKDRGSATVLLITDGTCK